MDGEHVRLRKLERADLPLLHRWYNDADVMAWARFSPDHMRSLEALEKEYAQELSGEEDARGTFVIAGRAPPGEGPGGPGLGDGGDGPAPAERVRPPGGAPRGPVAPRGERARDP